MGGVTAVFEMPNTNPTTTSAEALADKVARGAHRMHCDFAFFIGGTRENTADLPRARAAARLRRRQGVHGLVDRLAAGRGRRGRARHPARRSAAAPRSIPRTNTGCNERKHLRVEGDPRSHPVWRDEQAALQCTQRLVRLARETGKRVHVLHISTAQEMEFLKDHKDVASVEVTPHHLTLAAPGLLRAARHACADEPAGARRAPITTAIWRGVAAGHRRRARLRPRAAYARGEGQALSGDARPGMTGVQTLVPIMLDHVNAGRLSLARFVDLTSAGPARLFGIARKGRIAVGYDADLTVVDLKRRETITNRWIASRAGWTPYDGVSVTGWPVGTFVRGRRVMWEGELVDAVARRGGAIPRNDGGRAEALRARMRRRLRVIFIFHSVDLDTLA